MAIIYKHTSKTSGKIYIGQTCKTIKQRLSKHLYEAKNGSDTNFHRAIRKYGIDDFISVELESNINDLESLNQREIHYIKFYDTFKTGYNMTTGGDNKKMSQESVDKMVKVRHANGSFKTGGQNTLKTKQNTILKSGKTLLQETVDKATNTRKERGDYDLMSEKMKGTQFGHNMTCKHCGKVAKSGNYTRWHGDNCKLNPDITEEQLKKREPHNKGKKGL